MTQCGWLLPGASQVRAHQTRRYAFRSFQLLKTTFHKSYIYPGIRITIEGALEIDTAVMRFVVVVIVEVVMVVVVVMG